MYAREECLGIPCMLEKSAIEYYGQCSYGRFYKKLVRKEGIFSEGILSKGQLCRRFNVFRCFGKGLLGEGLSQVLCPGAICCLGFLFNVKCFFGSLIFLLLK